MNNAKKYMELIRKNVNLYNLIELYKNCGKNTKHFIFRPR